MNDRESLEKIGIRDQTFEFLTVAQLVKRGIIEKPLDGNHGEIHPKGEDFVASGIPFIMASDINDGVADYIGCKFITRKQADSLRKGFARNGDVLLTHKATIGRTAIVEYTWPSPSSGSRASGDSAGRTCCFTSTVFRWCSSN